MPLKPLYGELFSFGGGKCQSHSRALCQKGEKGKGEGLHSLEDLKRDLPTILTTPKGSSQRELFSCDKKERKKTEG